MKALRSVLTAAAAVYLLVGPASGADAPKDKPPPPATSTQGEKKPAPTTPVYTPPRRDAPRGRIGGGTRGPGDSLLGLYVLAPDHTGLTVQDQPEFYWHLSEATEYPIEFTLIEESAISPVVEAQIPSPDRTGIQRIQLSTYRVGLKDNAEYRWFVAVVADPNSRSKDILAGGFIEKIKTSDALRTRLAQGQDDWAPYVYAEEGIWYDALAAISKLIDAAPNDAALRRQRTELLEQVGLQEISADPNR